MIVNKIVNSRIFKFFPQAIQTKLLENIVYFERMNIKRLPSNNYDEQNLNIVFNEQINLNKKNLLKLNYTFPKLAKNIKKIYKKKFNYLDYGGGEIKNFLYLITFFRELKYFYKDKRYLENFYKKQKALKKFHQFNLFKKNVEYEIINFGSSLQYLKKINLTLNSIISKKTKVIIVSGIIIYEDISDNKIICVQRNIPGKKFLQYFYNKKYLVNIFSKYGLS